MAEQKHPGWRPDLLRQRREALALTLEELATAIRDLTENDPKPVSATFQSVGRHERGVVYPGRRYQRAYSAILGQSAADLGFHADRASPSQVSADAGDVMSRALVYPDAIADGITAVTTMSAADVANAPEIRRTAIAPDAWSEAARAWTLHLSAHGGPAAGRVQNPRGRLVVDDADVRAVRDTVRVFSALDFRFGGAHARHLVAEFIRRDLAALLRGTYTETVGLTLFSTAAEAALTAGWMAYDTGRHGLGQRYFIQALGLAQHAGDALLAGEVLGRMSHQATYTGHPRDAGDLARAATIATSREASPTLTAEFFAMEARAHARAGDAAACDAALSAAERAYARRGTDDAPGWAGYFDEAELAAELAHCFRDLGRPARAADHAAQSLALAQGQSPRSDFFTAMVLAQAQADADEPEAACDSARKALHRGDHLKSTRCVQYTAEFHRRLTRFRHSRTIRDFSEEAADRRLWRRALARESKG